MRLAVYVHIGRATAKAGQLTLRISIQENDNTIGFTLIGRLAGPWVTELDRAWKDVAPRFEGKTVLLDVRDLTYLDGAGKQVLREVFSCSRARFITSNDWSQSLAEEIETSISSTSNGRS